MQLEGQLLDNLASGSLSWHGLCIHIALVNLRRLVGREARR